MNDIMPMRRAAMENLQIPRSPKTDQFLDYHHELEQTVRDQQVRINQDSVEMTVMARRIEYLERELANEKRIRHEYQGGYFDMKAQIGVMTTSAISSLQTVIDTSVKVLEESKASMIRAGLDAGTTSQPDALDDGAAEIGRKFAALDPEAIRP